MLARGYKHVTGETITPYQDLIASYWVIQTLVYLINHLLKGQYINPLQL